MPEGFVMPLPLDNPVDHELQSVIVIDKPRQSQIGGPVTTIPPGELFSPTSGTSGPKSHCPTQGPQHKESQCRKCYSSKSQHNSRPRRKSTSVAAAKESSIEKTSFTSAEASVPPASLQSKELEISSKFSTTLESSRYWRDSSGRPSSLGSSSPRRRECRRK